MNKKLVVYTDLDGTLLDHHNYGFEPAKNMLAQLKALKIHVIPNTSKTFAELQEIRTKADLSGPFIVENGAAVYIPKTFFTHRPEDTEDVGDYWRRSFVPTRQHWLMLLANYASEFSEFYRGFSQMDDNEISLATGLDLEDAHLANRREFSEPLKWLGSEPQKSEFFKVMRAAGANVLQGGRFVHISGKSNKGIAMNWLTLQLQKQLPEFHYKAVALGDSFNDNDMLEAADIAVQIRSPKHDFPKLFRTDAVWQSRLLGPKGWDECLTQILQQELHLNEEHSYG